MVAAHWEAQHLRSRQHTSDTSPADFTQRWGDDCKIRGGSHFLSLLPNTASLGSIERRQRSPAAAPPKWGFALREELYPQRRRVPVTTMSTSRLPHQPRMPIVAVAIILHIVKYR
jgi:hypothetical protein